MSTAAHAVPAPPQAETACDYTPWYEWPLDRGLIPDPLLRWGIRRRLWARVRHEMRGGLEAENARFRGFLSDLSTSPIAIHTDAANQQHYELPPEFFSLVLGPRRKYSCCLYPHGVDTLAEAEEAMLALTCERAGVSDGMEILDLGCGWGSLSLWLCEKYPLARVLAISNSRPQREFITAEATRRGFANLQVITADANTFQPPPNPDGSPRRFDRILSVEMFEHMKNYRLLLERLAAMLHRPHGALFVHIFTHVRAAYHFERGSDWIGKYFFTGGVMPSDHLLLHFCEHLRVTEHWRVSGEHYRHTAEHWLSNMDNRRAQIMPVLERAYGRELAPAWFNRWRVFFMACAELWGLDRGRQWIVSHYLLRPRTPTVDDA